MGACCKAPTRKAPGLDSVRKSEAYSKPAQTVMSALGIYREAVKLVAMPEDPLRYSIEFAYSADYDCRVTAYWLCREIAAKSFKKVELKSSQLKPVTYLVSKGDHKAFPERTLILDLSTFQVQSLTFEDKQTYPLVLEISPHHFQAQFQVQWSFLVFFQEAEVWKVRVAQQKQQIGERLLEALEVFGAAEERKDCVICMTQNRSIVVLPCRHLCLCELCSQDFAQQSSKKCPICRCDVEGLLSTKQ